VARLILDTGILIGGARGRLPKAAVLDEDDVAVPAIVIAEFLVGIKQHTDPSRQASQRAFLDNVLEILPVEEYTPEVAEHHADLLVHTAGKGQPRGAHDLIIAATARAAGREIVTTDQRARFDELPDIKVRLVETAG
jgi:tRNA(fMet)-specific endonuclease VapC